MASLPWSQKAIALSILAASSVAAVDPSKYLFITGDSYTTTTFNATVGSQPTVDNPLGNPPYPGITLSGFDNWVDVVVYNCSPAGTVGYNYAVGGTPVNATRVGEARSAFPTNITDMIDQIGEFENLPRDVSWTASNSLFINWFGVNDISYTDLYNSQPSYDAALNVLQADAGDFFGQLDRLYADGARNFLNILVPPIHRAPVYVGSPTETLVVNLTNYWNDQITQGNTKWASQHTDAQSRIFDPSTTFNTILDNFQQYGAPNNTCYSYPAGQPCLWHDFLHPGLAIQHQLGKDIYSAIQETGFFG